MQPNSNVNNFFGIRVSQPGINVNQANQSQLLFQNDYSTQIFYDNDGNARVVLGLLPDSNYGLIVSLPGFDATTTNNLAFSSEQIVGTIDCPAVSLAPSGTHRYIFTVPHNLGYIPNYTVIGTVPNSYTVFPANVGKTVSINISGWYNNDYSDLNGLDYNYFVAVDQANLYISLLLGNSTGSTNSTLDINFQYYIIQQVSAPPPPVQ